MMLWWHETPIFHRFIICGVALVLGVFGLYTLMGSSLDISISKVQHDLVELDLKTQEAVMHMGLLKDVEQDVFRLREKMVQAIPEFTSRVEPQAFRRIVAHIGERTGVTIRLWKSQKPVLPSDQEDDSREIVVKVEGSFTGTVQFLNELLPLPWIQKVNPLVLTRKHGTQHEEMVMTDFTITSGGYQKFQQTQKLKTS